MSKLDITLKKIKPPLFLPAVQDFWRMRGLQAVKSAPDQGARGSATGGKQMSSLGLIFRKLAIEIGTPATSLFLNSKLELPGFFRPTKRWDLLVVHQGKLLAALEMKSHIGPSFGNNANNRAEEALGSAEDLWTAFREGAFGRGEPIPWLGFLVLLEDCKEVHCPVATPEPHFKVFRDFAKASYAKRYELLLDRLVLERKYTHTCLALTARPASKQGASLKEPVAHLSLTAFASSFLRHIAVQLGG